MKITLSFTDLDLAEAAHLLAQALATTAAPPPAAPGNASPPPAGAPTPPAAPPTAASAGAPPPTASAPSGAPPVAPAAPAAPAAPPANGLATQQTCLAAMQSYSATYKAAGVKAVLSKCGLTGIGNANQEQLTWLQQAFQSGLPPEQLG